MHITNSCIFEFINIFFVQAKPCFYTQRRKFAVAVIKCKDVMPVALCLNIYTKAIL